MKGIPYRDRFCEECNGALPRLARAGQRYCGPPCRNIGVNRLRFPDDPIEASIRGSDNLHRSIWAVYERVAAERGLAHPLVAAVQLGMRA